MPELPEIEITTRKLAPLRNKTISGFWSDWPRALATKRPISAVDSDIRGRTVLGLSRRGKAVLLELGPKIVRKTKTIKKILAFHLRMSGSLKIVRRQPKNKPRNQNKHVHAKLGFKDKSELWFEDPRKFGVIWYGTPQEIDQERYFARLGQDALRIPLQTFLALLRTRKGMIKPALLRQDIFAGIGNIVADETLSRAKIHPRRRIETLDSKKIKALHSSLQRVLTLAIKTQGTTLRNWGHPDGKQGKFQDYMLVYGKKDSPCGRCGYPITRIVVGARGTWICSRCQKP